MDLLKDYRTCLDVRADAGWDDLRNDLYESVVLRGEEMVIEVE